MSNTADVRCKGGACYELDALAGCAFVELRQNGFSCPIEAIPNDWALVIRVDDRVQQFSNLDLVRHRIPGPAWFEHRWLHRAIKRADLIVCSVWGGGEGIGRMAPLGRETAAARQKTLLDEVCRRRQSLLLVETLHDKVWPWIEVLLKKRRPGVRTFCLGENGEIEFSTSNGRSAL